MGRWFSKPITEKSKEKSKQSQITLFSIENCPKISHIKDISRMLKKTMHELSFLFFLVEHHGNLTQEQRLLDHLLQNYRTRRLIRPVKDLSKPIVIDFSAELVGVAKVVRKMYKFKKELEKNITPSDANAKN